LRVFRRASVVAGSLAPASTLPERGLKYRATHAT